MKLERQLALVFLVVAACVFGCGVCLGLGGVVQVVDQFPAQGTVRVLLAAVDEDVLDLGVGAGLVGGGVHDELLPIDGAGECEFHVSLSCEGG